jgi:hypothetical protein
VDEAAGAHYADAGGVFLRAEEIVRRHRAAPATASRSVARRAG